MDSRDLPYDFTSQLTDDCLKSTIRIGQYVRQFGVADRPGESGRVQWPRHRTNWIVATGTPAAAKPSQFFVADQGPKAAMVGG